MAELQIPYGSTQIDVEIEGQLLDPMDKDNPETSDVIKDALNKPLKTKRLRDIVNAKNNASIVIVVDDHTRDAPTQKMLSALSKEIGETHNDQVTLLVACGTHTPPTDDDLEDMLGTFRTRFDLQKHNCDAPDLVTVGTTQRGTPVKLNKCYMESDIKVLTGDITLHYYAGFGGGRKSILPGLSARETIKKNHALLVDEQARIANIDNNPVHLDMCEAASFAPPDYVLNTVANGFGTVRAAFAGDMTAVFQNGVEVAKNLLIHNTDRIFDVILVSAGGFPHDRNLYQASKAIENCYQVLAPGGKLILVAECRDGVGDQDFVKWMNTYSSLEETASAVKSNFVLGGHKAYYLRKAMNKFNVSLVSELDNEMLELWGIKAYNTIQDAVDVEINIKDKIQVGIVKCGKDILLIPSGNK
jgi:nickel-dependent lactate racemase